MKKAVIGVVGAGTMGRGIVQLFAQAGHRVYLYDAANEAVSAAIENITAMLHKMLSKGKLTEEQTNTAIEALQTCDKINDLSDCDIVIEAIIENIDIKQTVFKQLEAVVRPTTLLVSNTSSLLIADISAACQFPERVAGMHFFNPVPLMRVVEIIASVRTAASTVTALKNAIEGVGHRPVIAQDQPGFLVNHAGRGLYTEGLRLLEENVTDQNGVDTVLREVAGFRMGPFELLDLTGLDVSGKVMTSIYEQFFQEPLFRPSALVPPRIAAGLFGRKTSQGWYTYVDGKKVAAAQIAVPTLPANTRVWIDPNAAQYDLLKQRFTDGGATITDAQEPESILVIQPWGIDASHACSTQGLDARRCVAIDPMSNLTRQCTLMITPVTQAVCRDAIHALLAQDNTHDATCAVTIINDSPGFIVQRVLAIIVNTACHIAQRRIASVEDIEDAVKLGLGYPQGPLSWGDSLGGDKILNILDGMYEVTHDPRYRANIWLRRRVQLGVSLMTEEASRGKSA